jgi:hypothetical protein
MEKNQMVAIAIAIGMLIACSLLILLAVHVQIPDQAYCDAMLEHRHDGAFASVFYIESQTKYDFSLNQSKCIYNDNGDFIANPEYSIWGLRI